MLLHHGQQHHLAGKMVQRVKGQSPQRHPVQELVHKNGNVGHAVAHLIAAGEFCLALLQQPVLRGSHIVGLLYHVPVKQSQENPEDDADSQANEHTDCYQFFFLKYAKHNAPPFNFAKLCSIMSYRDSSISQCVVSLQIFPSHFSPLM